MESTKEKIEKILQESFAPNFLEVHDDSGRHAGHTGARGGGGHYQVIIVSSKFKDKTLIEQHRLVNESLKNLFKEKVHALALKTYSPEQWDSHNKY
ncbi:MAG: BolA family transcriptional regulator [Deltaproteobacteria bacterium]|nr:BolA family transcriptional regulator [Deltaproteobacteria bacterium]